MALDPIASDPVLDAFFGSKRVKAESYEPDDDVTSGGPCEGNSVRFVLIFEDPENQGAREIQTE